MKQLSRYLKGYWPHTVIAPILKFIEALFELIIPILVANIIDVGIPIGDTGYVKTQFWLMIMFGVLGLAFSLGCQYLASRAGQGFATALRRNMLAHVNTLSHQDLDKITASSLTTRITNDVNQTQQAVSMGLRLLTRSPFLIIGATIGAMMINFKISLIFLIAAVLIALTLYFIMSKSVPFYKKSAKALDRVAAVAKEDLAGTRVIRAFAKQQDEAARAHAAVKELTDTNLRVNRISALLNPLTLLIVNVGIIAIVWWGGALVETNGLKPGEIVALVSYMTQIQLSLVVLANLIVIFTRSSAAIARIKQVFELQNTMPETATAPITPVANAPVIETDDVYFSYNETATNCLNRLSFQIREGERFGIIGGTGSGKSTLVNLFPRFYDVTAGRVLVDGADVRDYPTQQLRAIFGIVPQKATLFAGTVRSNMVWRKRDATDQEIWDALETAQAKEFVEKLPKGLDTPVSQNGRNFSGGQRQRLTIARALVGNPRVLILDDSASALDAATDKRLRTAIRERKTTTLLISQRAYSLVDCDQILVLDGGEAVGLGKHDKLMETCPVYREIYLSQLSAKEREASV